MPGPRLTLRKADPASSSWAPLEAGSVRAGPAVRTVLIEDGAGRTYVEARPSGAGTLRFRARGQAGLHRVLALDAGGAEVARTGFRLAPATALVCTGGLYQRLAQRVWGNLLTSTEAGSGSLLVAGRVHQTCVNWLRDHSYTLKALRHFWRDVTSGTDLFLLQQQADGMLWDDINRNPSRAPAWLGEALGPRYHGYLDHGGWLLRRIPVEADVEYLAVLAVHHGWKAGGDDAWMSARLPRLERALAYTRGSPLRWSRRHGLVKRAYTMDSWDFKHPDPQVGGTHPDHRCLAEAAQPFFLFHGDNSGLYAAHRCLAEMYAALLRPGDAARHGRCADQLRRRANRVLWRDPIYAHQVPEQELPWLKQRVGDDDRRISLSLPYTINRGLPEHAQAVRILDEYRRRGRAQRRTSFAEWWTMDPMYLGGQWGDGNPTHQSPGEYMNGGISPLVAGELALAAFRHGREAYGADILRRLWRLSEADGGHIHDTYRRLPKLTGQPAPSQRQRPLDLRAQANVGLRHRAVRGVIAWTDEGDNDLRYLPTGRQRWLGVRLTVPDPAANAGCAVVALGGVHPAAVTVPYSGRVGCLYAAHALAGHTIGTVGWYDLVFADGTEHRFPLIAGRELANWWNPPTLHDDRSPPNVGRVGWRGPNPVVRDVGLYLAGFTNPRPRQPVTALRLTAAPGARLLVVALTVGADAARFPRGLRSFGLPAVWSQGAIHNALIEGLAGIEDTDRAFATACIAPRWAATEARAATVCVHYPASDGYCAYRWRHLPRRRLVEIDVTGSFARAELRVLMPAGRRPRQATCAGQPLPLRLETVERSCYALIALDRLPTAPVLIAY